MQTTGFADLLLFLLHHSIELTLDSSDGLTQGLNVGIIGGSFLRCRGNAFLQLNQGQGPIAPGLHQIPSQLSQSLIGVVGENTGVKAVATGCRRRGWRL